MKTKNQLQSGAILLMSFMTHNMIGFSQTVMQNSNPVHNYQQVSHFANNSMEPLRVIKGENKTTVFWNILNSFDKGLIAFCDNNNNILTAKQLNGRKTGKIDFYGNTEEMGIYCYKLIVDDWEVAVDNNLITPVEKSSVKATEALSGNY